VLVALDCDAAGEGRVKETADAVLAAGGWPARLRWPGGAKDACDLLARVGGVGLGQVLDLAAERAGKLRRGVA
jgi:hypothetical protein